MTDSGDINNEKVCLAGASTTNIGETIIIDWIQNCDSYGSFRLGFDWGHGGGVVVDGQLLPQIIVANEDGNFNWYRGNWGATGLNAPLLVPEQLWTAGRHIVQFVGFENCCDGYEALQQKPRGGVWSAVTNTFSFPCPGQ
jgi:hypothetical protein